MNHITRHCIAVRKVSVAAMIAAASLATPASASDHAPPPADHGGHGGHGNAAAAVDTGTFDLGEFHLRNFRPTHNKTASIRFSLHLVVDPEAEPGDLEALANWQRRLRDQAIIAVRSAEAADLAEPDLARVRRLIIIRLNRLPVAHLIQGVYLTNFAVGDG
jgi:hypothetical protein